jgi:predicted PurR-regulated permease PerM
MALKPDVHWKPTVRYLAFAILFVLLALGLWYVRRVIEPLIIAAFIAYLIHPVVNYLTQRARMTRKVAVNLVYFITLAILVGVPATLTPLFFDELRQVASDTLNIFNQLAIWLMQPQVFLGLPLDLSQYAGQLVTFRSTFLTNLPDQALQLLGKTSLTALWTLVILVAVYYFLARWPSMRSGFIGSFPEAYQPELAELYQRLRLIWLSYLRGQLTLMVIVGVSFTISWTILGIPGALVLGVLAGLMTIIPDVGPFLAAVLAFAVALLEGSNWSWMPASHIVDALIVLAVYLVLIGIKNFWLRPVIMGHSVRMHEAVVLVSILLATVLWGILGALLVVPLLASAVVIGDYLRRRILGLPPFPPAEPFVSPETPQAASEKSAALKDRRKTLRTAVKKTKPSRKKG